MLHSCAVLELSGPTCKRAVILYYVRMRHESMWMRLGIAPRIQKPLETIYGREWSPSLLGADYQKIHCIGG